MAHSNRKKKREERGGKTRHQALKAMRASKYSSADKTARIKELEAWSESLAEKRKNPTDTTPKTVTKVKKKVNMKGRVKDRRTRVLAARQAQLLAGTKPEKRYLEVSETYLFTGKQVPLEEADKKRITKEMDTLVKRGAISKTK